VFTYVWGVVGVYRSTNIGAYIDIKDVAELRATSTSPVLTVGGNVTLTEAMRLFNENASQPGYAYLRQLAQHIDKIANVPVRNVSSLQ
jgi:xanthine dehydrogenase/oxidase